MQLTSLAQTALATEGTVSHSTTHGCKTCAVYAHKKQKDGKRKDDVPSLLKAFKDCGNGGYIESPAGQNYRIAQRLNPVLHNVKIDWLGTWTVGAVELTIISVRR